ncbi:NnrS family protein [Afifella sp. JA880]|uniref:NnrS family protein n=1 Tax=Afifella sp. JA880 TaxID=2975280 RepID=UPI0021BB501A|nr:NnrS family protein [Afifella sp. JA880]MCT8268301.1 NnrS family protein [Afifella sp. JA880]
MSAFSAAAAADPGRRSGWFLAAPFRPFFIGASLFAASAVPVWLWLYLFEPVEVAGMPALAWHAHEMVFGYLPAVMAGYLLSLAGEGAGEGALPGRSLALLFFLWIAGRLLPLFVPFAIGTAVDVLFPLAVAGVLLKLSRFPGAKQSKHGLVLFPLLAAASLAHRVFALGDGAADYEMVALLSRLGISVGALLIGAVGGRLVPELTRLALGDEAGGRVPEPYRRFDLIALLSLSAGLVAWVLVPSHPLTFVLAGMAALINLARLLRWRGFLLGDLPTLALHGGYLWLIAGLCLAALAASPASLVPADAALHALSAGAIGTMTLAVMARLAVSVEPGRPVGKAVRLAIVLVHAGALLRVAAPLVVDLYRPLLASSGTFWSAAFFLFFVVQIMPLFGGRGRIRET